MKRFHHLMTTAVMLTLLSGNLYAEKANIGIVNVNTVLQKSSLLTSLNNETMKRLQPRQNELDELQNQLQYDTNKLVIDAEIMSTDDQNKLKANIAINETILEILTAGLQHDLAVAQDEAKKKSTAKVNAVIQRLAHSGDYVIIEQDNKLLFINSNLDDTQQVLNDGEVAPLMVRPTSN